MTETEYTDMISVDESPTSGGRCGRKEATDGEGTFDGERV